MYSNSRREVCCENIDMKGTLSVTDECNIQTKVTVPELQFIHHLILFIFHHCLHWHECGSNQGYSTAEKASPEKVW